MTIEMGEIVRKKKKKKKGRQRSARARARACWVFWSYPAAPHHQVSRLLFYVFFFFLTISRESESAL